jgi:hypothetical protein
MLTLSGITKSYRARTLFTAAALQLNHGERGLGHNVLAG